MTPGFVDYPPEEDEPLHSVRESRDPGSSAKPGVRLHPIIDTNSMEKSGIQPEPPTAPEAKALSQFARHGTDDPNELLKHRFLCRGGGLLLVGPSGIGKSSFSMQAMLHWAIGLPLFGIQPAKSLKSLMIQAENDDGDIAEMRDGVLPGLGLTLQQEHDATRNVVVCREDTRTSRRFFEEVVKPLVEEHKPDILWIDPALSYLGGEANAQKDVSAFLRNMMNPILRQWNIGVVVVHHTNKPTQGKEKAEWSGGDFAYLGSGSAEWANWARAVLAIRSLGSHNTFELVAGKRGGRLGWKESDGSTKAYSKSIGHSDKPGVICWREVDPLIAPLGRRAPTPEDVLAHVPTSGSISKQALQGKTNGSGIAVNRFNGLVAQLIEGQQLYEWEVKRPGTRPEKRLSRSPQPQPELLR